MGKPIIYVMKERTSNDIIAGNGTVPKAFMFTVWFYLFKNI